MVVLPKEVHPRASVIVTSYSPAAKFAKSSIVEPFDQLYEYEGVPPETIKLILPVLFPKQFTLTCEMVLLSNAGWVTTIDRLVVHPLASVIKTSYVSATSPLTSSFVELFDHMN